jgi:hypothetical protein
MKRVKSLLAVASLAFGLFIMNACSDPCKDVTCLNGGVCDEGDCICATGYEGTDCGTEMRTKFLGSYSFIDGCYPGTTTSSTIATSVDGVNRVNVTNILGTSLGGTAKATINGTNITIPSQSVNDIDNDVWTVEGMSTGTLTSNSFSISVKFIFGTTTETCLLTFTKQ